MSNPLSRIPDMDSREFDEAAIRARWDRYERMTDAEYILDPEAFDQGYRFAAHASARDVPALLAEIRRLRGAQP